MDRGAWRAMVHGVTKSWAQLSNLAQHDSTLVCSGCHNKEPQTEWHKHQLFIFPQFWRIEVWVQGVGLVSSETLFLGLQTAIFFLGLPMVFSL